MTAGLELRGGDEDMAAAFEAALAGGPGLSGAPDPERHRT
jgi:hypothetical protein